MAKALDLRGVGARTQRGSAGEDAAVRSGQRLQDLDGVHGTQRDAGVGLDGLVGSAAVEKTRFVRSAVEEAVVKPAD